MQSATSAMNNPTSAMTSQQPAAASSGGAGGMSANTTTFGLGFPGIGIKPAPGFGNFRSPVSAQQNRFSASSASARSSAQGGASIRTGAGSAAGKPPASAPSNAATGTNVPRLQLQFAGKSTPATQLSTNVSSTANTSLFIA
ncbi:unnamed protein product [Amoebophrya sp. A120]|nr:unnamed protein product [Amoebophrya sp. A120]|eukprot:GSA120T00025991001.1